MRDEEKSREQLISELRLLRRQVSSRPSVRHFEGCEYVEEVPAHCKRRYLVAGKYGVRELVEIDSLQKVFSAFSAATGLALGLVEYPTQRVLIATGWRKICTDFHWDCPESLRQCTKSYALLTDGLCSERSLIINECENGMMEGATPIIMRGKHIASITTGQVFFQRPHLAYFRRQAEFFGYDPDAYLDAVNRVPVISEPQLRSALTFLSQLATMIVELGLSNLDIGETLSDLRKEIIERKKTEEALQQSRNELRRISSQLLIAQEEERKRIAGELHDGLGSYLTAIRFSLEAARKKLARGKEISPESLDLPISEMERLMGEVRRIWIDPRPSVLDSLGLVAALEYFMRQYSSNCPELKIEREWRVEEQDISEQQRIVIFRIIQEAFNNIAKHSGADSVHISLVRKDTGIELRIRDNGRGFSPDCEQVKDRQPGIGLASMKQRAEFSGGKLSIVSANGCGTRLNVSWPLVEPSMC